MLLKVFHTRAELQDNVGNTMAVLAFPEVQEGVCEMHDIYLNVDSIKESARNKMITYALVQIRKNNWQVIPAGPETSAWFDAHPSDCDLLRSASNPAPVVQEPKEEVKEEKPVQVQEPTVAPQPVESVQAKPASKIMRILARFLQVVSAACMMGIMGVFGYNWFLNRSIGFWMFSLGDPIYWSFLAANAGFIFICLLFLFWMMSRKVLVIDGQETYKDTGRGISAFILILLAFVAASVAIGMFGYIIPSLVEYVRLFFVQLTMIPVLAFVGLVVSIIRKVICR